MVAVFNCGVALFLRGFTLPHPKQFRKTKKPEADAGMIGFQRCACQVVLSYARTLAVGSDSASFLPSDVLKHAANRPSGWSDLIAVPIRMSINGFGGISLAMMTSETWSTPSQANLIL
jgi:hypothetical protein